MPNYRRACVPGGTFFFTVVTFQRRKLFINDQTRLLFQRINQNIQLRYPFQIIAYCIMPEHIHAIWTLPEGDSDFSKRWCAIKTNFSREWHLKCKEINSSGNGPIWQRGFWEHVIRDEKDLNNHIDYIHYNPIKHGIVKKIVGMARFIIFFIHE